MGSEMCIRDRNMVASMCTDTILTVQRVRRFARRTRDYCRAYLALEKGGDIESKKVRRNILDMEPGFIDKQLYPWPTSWPFVDCPFCVSSLSLRLSFCLVFLCCPSVGPPAGHRNDQTNQQIPTLFPRDSACALNACLFLSKVQFC